MTQMTGMDHLFNIVGLYDGPTRTAAHFLPYAKIAEKHIGEKVELSSLPVTDREIKVERFLTSDNVYYAEIFLGNDNEDRPVYKKYALVNEGGYTVDGTTLKIDAHQTHITFGKTAEDKEGNPRLFYQIDETTGDLPLNDINLKNKMYIYALFNAATLGLNQVVPFVYQYVKTIGKVLAVWNLFINPYKYYQNLWKLVWAPVGLVALLTAPIAYCVGILSAESTRKVIATWEDYIYDQSWYGYCLRPTREDHTRKARGEPWQITQNFTWASTKTVYTNNDTKIMNITLMSTPSDITAMVLYSKPLTIFELIKSGEFNR